MSSRRRQQRWATTRLQRRAVNMMVAVYSFLALGSPATAATADTARCRLTGLQWKAVELMEERLRYLSRAAGRVSVAGGRHLILEEILKDCDLGDAYGAGGSTGGAPMSVTSELISLPPAAAVVALADVVPPRVAECLATPGAFDLPPEEWPDRRPAGCSLVSSDEWLRLLRRMLTCGMVTIRAEEELLQ